MDFSETGWWLRGLFVPTTDEMGLVVLQHHNTVYPDMLNIGVVIGSDEKNAYEQLFNTTFDRTLGESEVLLRMAILIDNGEIIRAAKDTALERGLNTMQIIGNKEFAFDSAILNMFRDAGFSGSDTVLHMDVHERNSNQSDSDI